MRKRANSYVFSNTRGGMRLDRVGWREEEPGSSVCRDRGNGVGVGVGVGAGAGLLPDTPWGYRRPSRQATYGKCGQSVSAVVSNHRAVVGHGHPQAELQPYSGRLARVRRNRADTRLLSTIRVSRVANLRGPGGTRARAVTRDRLAPPLVGAAARHDVRRRSHVGLDAAVLGQAAVARRVYDRLRASIRERVRTTTGWQSARRRGNQLAHPIHTQAQAIGDSARARGRPNVSQSWRSSNERGVRRGTHSHDSR